MFDDLWAIILAAGKSQRFVDEGYTTPKPLLRLRSKGGAECSMLSHIEDSIPIGLDHIFVVLSEGIEKPKDFLGRVIKIRDTKGQADTALKAIKQEIDVNKKILLLDCDMILTTYDQIKIVESLDFYNITVAVTETFDPNSSRVDRIPYPTKFAEKEPISQWGIVSARGFSSAKDLELSLQYAISAEGDKISLSTAMNYHRGSKYAHVITKYIDLGTPQRIEQSGWKILDKKE